jgi:AraC family transcriptional regulator
MVDPIYLSTFNRNVRKCSILDPMYFTALPDHTAPGFDERKHFSRFSQHNMIFNAFSRETYCEKHVGCLSVKTVLSGEEWYGVDGRQVAIRPGQFLILNDNQDYSCRIPKGDGARVLSVFFKKEFAASILHDMVTREDQLLDDLTDPQSKNPEFFQTLHAVEPDLAKSLSSLVTRLEIYGDDPNRMDEGLVVLLRHLVRTHRSDRQSLGQVDAVKPSTKKEIYKRLCIARDILHTLFQEPLELSELSARACLSMPQLIRQFKSVFGRTPYQYLVDIRLSHAAELLKKSSAPVREIVWHCGFNDASAFGRAFKSAYGIPPEQFRNSRLF